MYIPYYECDASNYPTEGTPECDYHYFTKVHHDIRVEFDGEVFTCYHKSVFEYRNKVKIGKIWESYDGTAKKYRVIHKIEKKK
jgi:hypothetical protein